MKDIEINVASAPEHRAFDVSVVGKARVRINNAEHSATHR
jgi:hypothetical protein